MTYEIFSGDCLGLRCPPCDLIYMDPPFGPVGEDVYYGVGKDFDEYLCSSGSSMCVQVKKTSTSSCT